ncbi:acyltransferase family protein [Leifsonia poae]|uniref:acyltransferase family protein n=1 Tax=Leifsonia poae TaxID=110933 RepID=UPI001CBEE037|nr:acyltransferase [Leifsonia poae]
MAAATVTPSGTAAAFAASASLISARPTGPARAPRDTTVDIARAWCLVVVVALHSLMVGVSVAAAGPVLANALEGWSWFPAVSWFAQIMPLFVVLGGFSSFTQWSRMRARGVRPADYIAQRMRRLLRPAVAAIAAVVIVLAALAIAGVPAAIVATAGFRLSQPLWFLGVYILCTAFVPLLETAHRRRPVVTVVGLLAAVLAVDIVRNTTGVTAVGFANLLFVWLLIQQLGFWLADGRIPGLGRRRLSLLAAAAYAALFVLAACGVYSFDMLANLNPPTAALVVLGVGQASLFELARPALRRLEGIRPFAAAVTAINARAMTIYLWHMLVLIGLAGALLLTGQRLPVPLSAEWWLSRPLWLAAVTIGVAAVVAAAGRIELARAGGDAVHGRPGAFAYLGAAAGAGGVLLILVTGFSAAGGVLGLALVAGAEALSHRGGVSAILPRAELR